MHGGDGTFLSSLAALSVLTITSHYEAENSHATLILHHSRPAARLLPAPAYHDLSNREHGTRVTVQELFGNMPVRIKQRAMLYRGREWEKQWEALSKSVVGFLLAWDASVTFTLNGVESSRKLKVRREDAYPFSGTKTITSSKVFDFSLIRRILSQSAYIEPSEWEDWIRTTAETPSVIIQGAISLQPAPSKQAQFLSLGIQYLSVESHNVLYDVVNEVFAKSSFGKQDDLDYENAQRKYERTDGRRKENGFTNKQLRGGAKGVDRWPKFFIRIDLQSRPHVRSKSDLTKLEMKSTISTITDVLEAMITSFLNDYHFRPKTKQLKKIRTTVIEPYSKSNQYTLDFQESFFKKSIAGVSSHTGSSKESIINFETCTNTGSSLAETGKRAVKWCDKAGVTTSANALGGTIKLPNFSQRDIHINAYFSTWSRVKSGKRESLQELISQQKLRNVEQQPKNFQRLDTRKVLPPKEHKPELDDLMAASSDKSMNRAVLIGITDNSTPLHDHPRKDSIRDGEDASSEATNGTIFVAHEDAEETIEWMNPVSKAITLINSRTGLVVSRSFSGTSSNLNSKPEKPKVRDLRPTRKRKRLGDSFGTIDAGSWTSELLKTWDNPVFSLSEESVPRISFDGPSLESPCMINGKKNVCSGLDVQKAFSESSSFCFSKLSKEALGSAKVIAQVDKKFILINMNITSKRNSIADSSSVSKPFLILVDQHAADERIRIEGLIAELCRKPLLGNSIIPDCSHSVSSVMTTLLVKPITFQVQARECTLFTRHASHFANWGILYTIGKQPAEDTSVRHQWSQLTVKALPEVIAERCRVDVKVLIDLMRGEVWKSEDSGKSSTVYLDEPSTPIAGDKSVPDFHQSVQPNQHSWLNRISGCPQGILDMLNSRSCRSAIMFNDELTIGECQTLVKRLAACAFPFQCAHGRPSMIPLVQLGSSSSCFEEGTPAFGARQDFVNSRIEKDFGLAWKTWKNTIVKSCEMGNDDLRGKKT